MATNEKKKTVQTKKPKSEYDKSELKNKLPVSEYDANGRPILNIEGIDDVDLSSTMKRFLN